MRESTVEETRAWCSNDLNAKRKSSIIREPEWYGSCRQPKHVPYPARPSVCKAKEKRERSMPWGRHRQSGNQENAVLTDCLYHLPPQLTPRLQAAAAGQRVGQRESATLSVWRWPF